MRNGARTKLFVLLLAVSLVFNAAAFAQEADDGMGMDFDFVEAPNELDEDVTVDLGMDFVDDVVLQEEAEAELMAAEGQKIAPGRVIEYNGLTYRIEANATNFVTAIGDGSFSAMPNPFSQDSGAADRTFIATAGGSINPNDGHDGLGCFEYDSGTLIWRCGANTFTSDKYYVYSAWFKFTGDANLDNGQRHIAGTSDVINDSPHVNEIGRDIEKTGDWQQDMCVFRGAGSENRFLYLPYVGGKGSIRMDDFVIYEVTPIPAIVIDDNTVENPVTWEEYDEIPDVGVPYNQIINYTVNITNPMVFNGVVAIFKDGKLWDIVQRQVDSRTAILYDGELTPAKGSVSVPFEIDEGEDVSRFSCLAYLCDPKDPFNIYGNASESYAVLISGRQQ